MDQRERAPTLKMQEYMTQKVLSTTDGTPVPSKLARFSDEISQMQQKKGRKRRRRRKKKKEKERDTREERGRENKPHGKYDG